MIAEGILWKIRRAGSSLACVMRVFEHQGERRRVHRGGQVRRVAHENSLEEFGEMMTIGGVPWQNDDDPKLDGESLKGEVMVMNKDYRERGKEEYVLVPERVYITRRRKP